MIAVVLVVIGIAAAFALGVIAAYMYMDEDDTSDPWEDERIRMLSFYLEIQEEKEEEEKDERNDD